MPDTPDTTVTVRDFYYKLTEEDRKGIEKAKKMFREWQCDACKRDGPGACSATKENARAYIQREDGTIKYFCQIGCLLLRLSEEDMHALVLSQFDRVGDYLRQEGIPYLEDPVSTK